MYPVAYAIKLLALIGSNVVVEAGKVFEVFDTWVDNTE